MKYTMLVLFSIILAVLLYLFFLLASNTPLVVKAEKKVIKQVKVPEEQKKEEYTFTVVPLVEPGKNKVKKRTSRQEKKPIAKKITLKKSKSKATPFQRISYSKSSTTHEIKIKKRHQIKGQKLLERGKAPLIELDYSPIGIDRYLEIMKAMGGRIFIGRGYNRKILGEISLYRVGSIQSIVLDEGNINLQGLAAWRPRELVGEEKVIEDIRAIGEDRFSGEDLRVAVILPIDKEAAFVGALKEAIENSNLKSEDIFYFSGEYRELNGKTYLYVKEGTLKDGRKINLHYRLNLSNLIWDY